MKRKVAVRKLGEVIDQLGEAEEAISELAPFAHRGDYTRAGREGTEALLLEGAELAPYEYACGVISAVGNFLSCLQTAIEDTKGA